MIVSAASMCTFVDDYLVQLYLKAKPCHLRAGDEKGKHFFLIYTLTHTHAQTHTDTCHDDTYLISSTFFDKNRNKLYM